MHTDEFEYDGHVYKLDGTDEDVHHLGSLIGTAQAHNPNLRSYTGLYADKDKLPHYDDLETGSDALLVDPVDGLKYLYYEKTTDTWYEG